MKAINSLDELSFIIKKYFKKGYITNNYYHISTYLEDILNGDLFFCEINESALFLRKRSKHYIGIYYINIFDGINFGKIADILDSKMIVEVTFKNTIDDDIVNIFINNGFKIELERIRYINNGIHDFVENTNKNIVFPKIDSISEILNLLENNFNVQTSFLPTEKQLIENISSNNILIFEEMGKIIGLIRFEDKKVSSEILHLVVDKKHRNKGIATSLLFRYLELTKYKKSFVWTGLREAQLFYDKHGYSKDNYKSIVFAY